MTDSFRFSYIETESDLEQYAALLRLAFPGEGVDVFGKHLYVNHPDMTSRNFFALWDGDLMVATLNLIPMTWSLGGITLKVAEMGVVGTHPEYRHRGLQRQLNVEFDRRVGEGGYHLAAIEGIPYFYRQFGYEYSVPLDEWAAIPLDKLPTGDVSGISPLKPNEISRAMSLLEATQRKHLVHCIRSREEWETQEKSGIVGEHPSKTYAVRNKGKIIAYFRASVEDKTVLLHEITETDKATSVIVAAFLRRLGEENGASELVSRESYVEPFDEYLFSLGTSKRRPYGWQMKVVDPYRVLERIAPLFEERIRNSPLKGYSGTVPLNLYGVTVTLTFQNGAVTGVEQSPSEQKGDILVNPRVFPKMLLGYRSLDELEAEYPDVRIKPEYRPIIDILFPKGSSHIHTTY
ncbi:MAG: GNAT family N-acetyltransferase [Candidatus Bathyarchaeota archaeon]|nr:GNAT family N-acetyltransferase [Candidatus Bathyarchaeota archaeon]